MRTSRDNIAGSAAKRIIPAAAMLALSAVMLSTSTYAWFTMNKEVKMTGLAMSATTGDGIEIALACVSDSKAITAPTGDHPGDDDMGWKSAVVVGDYYEKIGKLKPASSIDGKNLYDATDASNGGQTANNFVKIELDTSSTSDDAKKMAELTMKTSLNETAAGGTAPKIEADGREGYYVDIPVYLRTTKAKGDTDKGPIYCKLIIKNNTTDEKGTLIANKELYKSVRVAFVPMDTNSSATVNIFGFNKEYYSGETAEAVSGETTKSAVTVNTDVVKDGDAFADGEGAKTGLEIPFAVGTDKYGHLDFVVRVWIEGESKFCKDANSGQSWNIDLAFSLDKFGESGSST